MALRFHLISEIRLYRFLLNCRLSGGFRVFMTDRRTSAVYSPQRGLSSRRPHSQLRSKTFQMMTNDDDVSLPGEAFHATSTVIQALTLSAEIVV